MQGVASQTLCSVNKKCAEDNDCFLLSQKVYASLKTTPNSQDTEIFA